MCFVFVGKNHINVLIQNFARTSLLAATTSNAAKSKLTLQPACLAGEGLQSCRD